MKNTVITKNIDDLGRIVLPKDIRSSVDVRVEDEKIIITKVQDSCIFCHSKLNLTDFKGKKICQNCLSEIK